MTSSSVEKEVCECVSIFSLLLSLAEEDEPINWISTADFASAGHISQFAKIQNGLAIFLEHKVYYKIGPWRQDGGKCPSFSIWRDCYCTCAVRTTWSALCAEEQRESHGRGRWAFTLLRRCKPTIIHHWYESKRQNFLAQTQGKVTITDWSLFLCFQFPWRFKYKHTDQRCNIAIKWQKLMMLVVGILATAAAAALVHQDGSCFLLPPAFRIGFQWKFMEHLRAIASWLAIWRQCCLQFDCNPPRLTSKPWIFFRLTIYDVRSIVPFRPLFQWRAGEECLIVILLPDRVAQSVNDDVSIAICMPLLPSAIVVLDSALPCRSVSG